MATSNETLQTPSFTTLVTFSAKRIWYPILVFPFVLACVLSYLIEIETFGSLRSFWESSAIRILYLAGAGCLVRFAIAHEKFFLWAAFLTGSFLCREYHWEWTGDAVYLMVFLLFLIAWSKYAWFEEYLGSKFVLTLLALALTCYLVAVGLDQHWWPFMPGDKHVWHRAEEILEITGHLCILILPIFARKTESPLSQLPVGFNGEDASGSNGEDASASNDEEASASSE